MSEKFSLKWNDFHSNVSKSFGMFRNEKYLQDVTLVGDDDLQLKAHKFVLSTCSSYFKKIFTLNSQANILLCLEGTTQTDLNNILEYIYYGEVQLYQEELERFLNVAKRIKLEGLQEEDKINLQPNQSLIKTEEPISIDPLEPVLPMKIKRKTDHEFDTKVKRDKPHQPLLTSYAPYHDGHNMRDFQQEWFLKFPWLQFDENSKVANCFACDKFGNVLWEFSTWKNSSMLGRHTVTRNHKAAMTKWVNFFTQKKVV